MRSYGGSLFVLSALLVLSAAAPAQQKAEARLQAVLRISGKVLPDGAGFEITALDANGPAANLTPTNGTAVRGILEKGDVIVSVDGKKFSSLHEMMDLLNAGHTANRGKVTIGVRDTQTGRVVLWVARPELVRTEVPAGPALATSNMPLRPRPGVVTRIQAMLLTNGKYLPNGKGYLVTAVAADGPVANLVPADGKAVRGILEKGDVITAIDGKGFRDRREFRERMNEAYSRGEGKVSLTVVDATTKQVKVWIARPVLRTVAASPAGESRQAGAPPRPVDPLDAVLGKPARAASDVPPVPTLP